MGDREINPEKILFIQLRSIGDVLMTTPAVRAVKKRFPQAKTVFLTEPPSDEIFRNNPCVDEVLCYDRKWKLKDYLRFIHNLRQRQFDLVVDFFCNPRSAPISLFSGARYRIGFNARGRAWCYTTRVNMSEDRDVYSPLDKLLLLKPLGITAEDCRIEFFCSSDDYKYAEELCQRLGINRDEFVVAVCPASASQFKVWQAEKFAWVADNLIERYGAKILFMWGPGEEYFISQIKSQMKHQNKVLDDYDVPTLRQVRALFERVRLYIGTDNGLRHIAITAHTPTVTVFGQPNPYNWTPPGDNRHRFVAYDPGCKMNCRSNCKNYPCITEISETEYLSEIEGLIEELGLSKRGRNG